MSTNFRNSGNGGIGDNLDDTAYEAAPEHPPAAKLGLGICQVIFGGFTNVVQVVTSTIAIMALVLGAAAVTLKNFLDLFGLFPYAAMIALVIAGAVQLFLHMNAQSMSSTFHRLRQIQHFNIKSVNSLSDVKAALTIGNLYFGLALLADIVSDATFVNLYTHSAYVILFWIVFLTGSSTLLLYNGLTRIWGAVEDLKDYRAYHRKHDPDGK